MYNYLNDDPLGIGLRQRAYDSKRQYDEQNRELGRANGQLVNFSNLGPISDPMWDAFKQAYHEQGVDRFAGGSLPLSQFGGPAGQAAPQIPQSVTRAGITEYANPAQASMHAMKRSTSRRR